LSGQLAIAHSNANQINPFEHGNPHKFHHESNAALERSSDAGEAAARQMLLLLP
jgi:hypothetical protein